jgi:hypothetical protein
MKKMEKLFVEDNYFLNESYPQFLINVHKKIQDQYI